MIQSLSNVNIKPKKNNLSGFNIIGFPIDQELISKLVYNPLFYYGHGL